MTRYTHQMTIGCSPALVFALLLDPAFNRQWQTGVVRTEWTDSHVGVGTTITEVRELAGRHVTIAYELLEVQWPCRSVVRLVAGPLRGTASYGCRPVADGTELTVSCDVCPVGRWRSAAPALRAALAVDVTLSCQRLAALAEAAGSAPAVASARRPARLHAARSPRMSRTGDRLSGGRYGIREAAR